MDICPSARCAHGGGGPGASVCREHHTLLVAGMVPPAAWLVDHARHVQTSVASSPQLHEQVAVFPEVGTAVAEASTDPSITAQLRFAIAFEAVSRKRDSQRVKQAFRAPSEIRQRRSEASPAPSETQERRCDITSQACGVTQLPCSLGSCLTHHVQCLPLCSTGFEHLTANLGQHGWWWTTQQASSDRTAIA